MEHYRTYKVKEGADITDPIPVNANNTYRISFDAKSTGKESHFNFYVKMLDQHGEELCDKLGGGIDKFKEMTLSDGDQNLTIRDRYLINSCFSFKI